MFALMDGEIHWRGHECVCNLSCMFLCIVVCAVALLWLLAWICCHMASAQEHMRQGSAEENDHISHCQDFLNFSTCTWEIFYGGEGPQILWLCYKFSLAMTVRQIFGFLQKINQITKVWSLESAPVFYIGNLCTSPPYGLNLKLWDLRLDKNIMDQVPVSLIVCAVSHSSRYKPDAGMSEFWEAEIA